MLTTDEINLVNDSRFLLEKRKILKKISYGLGEVEITLKELINQGGYHFPEGTLTKSGKISRGENYKGLPYLVLDFPRYSENEQIFIFRTMFWWGNYFLCLLITQNCGYTINANEAGSNLLINLGESPWDYDIAGSDWAPLNSLEHPPNHPFLALGSTLSLDRMDELPNTSKTTFQTIMTFMSK